MAPARSDCRLYLHYRLIPSSHRYDAGAAVLEGPKGANPASGGAATVATPASQRRRRWPRIPPSIPAAGISPQRAASDLGTTAASLCCAGGFVPDEHSKSLWLGFASA
ncbi:hypothetical protein PUNSTDRAFT_131921 [Punctularia strigosozonata HHB-11173 SS5]|uniref:uncharacterized protein n=1 Tax=Punctularia strigosozonata (strain HHB-11173) TaxID=741275 RepID=UPI0004416D0F|nr:uncharacterized protein PUNSTDRAFT_131921 [Punctularia strigosozonata HHB-11173 SS5]EIN11766.1 hypothetical protein PUNSTDRAFT_131921 [Punctularia strigosozonata HHB-11173 SS5]